MQVLVVELQFVHGAGFVPQMQLPDGQVGKAAGLQGPEHEVDGEPGQSLILPAVQEEMAGTQHPPVVLEPHGPDVGRQHVPL
jgi:hypothetical protein